MDVLYSKYNETDLIDSGSIISNIYHDVHSGHSILEHLDEDWKILFSALYALISIFGSIANFVVLWTLYKFHVLHTKSNKLLAALALTDLLTAMIVAPMIVVQLQNNNSSVLNRIYQTRTFLSTVLLLASDYITAFISFDRCLHIIKLTEYNMENKTLYFVLTLCWLFPVLTSLLIPAGLGQLFVYVVNGEVLVILLILALFYTTLLITLHRYTSQNESILNDSYIRDQTRTAKTIVIIVTLYIFMRVPILVSFFVIMVHPHNLDFNTEFYIICYMLCISNSLMNPVIYGYRTLREYIRKLYIKSAFHREVYNGEYSSNSNLESNTTVL